MENSTSKGRWRRVLELFWTFFKIGAFTFGGGYAMISMVELEVVKTKHWIDDKHFIDMIAISQATPGVIAINMATYVGFEVGGFWGSLLATIGVSLPSFIIMIILSFFFEAFLALKWVGFAFNGIRAGIIVLIFDAVLRLRKSMPVDAFNLIVLLASFIISTFTDFSVIYLLLISGVIGIVWQVFIRRAYTDGGEK